MKHLHFRRIYAEEPERYDRLVAREDHRGQLLPAIEEITPLAGKTIVEFGAGTARLTRLLCLRAKQLLAVDISIPMLCVAESRLRESGAMNWQLLNADHRQMPLPERCADIAIAGWTFGQFVDENPQYWLPAMAKALYEAERLLRPGGTIIIIETLGTLQRKPAPPNEPLADYYRWLTEKQHFQQRWLRTDYQFTSVSEATSEIRFFFGDEMAEKVAKRSSAMVPECSGIWWRTAS